MSALVVRGGPERLTEIGFTLANGFEERNTPWNIRGGAMMRALVCAVWRMSIRCWRSSRRGAAAACVSLEGLVGLQLVRPGLGASAFDQRIAVGTVFARSFSW